MTYTCLFYAYAYVALCLTMPMLCIVRQIYIVRYLNENVHMHCRPMSLHLIAIQYHSHSSTIPLDKKNTDLEKDSQYMYNDT